MSSYGWPLQGAAVQGVCGVGASRAWNLRIVEVGPQGKRPRHCSWRSALGDGLRCV